MTERRQGSTSSADPPAQLGPRSRIRAVVLLAMTAGGLALCAVLIVPFLPALAWALALAVLFAAPHRWIERRLGHRKNMAATVSIVILGLVIVAPLLLLGHRVVVAAIGGAGTLQQKVESGDLQRALQDDGALAVVGTFIARADIAGVVGQLTSWAAEASAAFVRGWAVEVITIVLAFYLAFYFLRDRAAILAWCRDVSPLSPAETDRLFARIADTVHATLFGTVAVAFVQGTLGGLIFWLLGLPAPLLWGLVMGVLAVVPVLGTFVVWLPAAIFLLLDGDWTKALILAGFGGVVIGGIDNLLYPALVGDRMKLHTVPAFVAIVGGLILFGPAGLLLGPIVMTATVFALELWRVRVRR